MLGLLLVQGVSGLFNSDDILFNGPFYYAASGEFRDTMGVVHEVAFDLLSAFIALHVAAVLFYQLRRRQPLLQAMLRGSAEGKEGAAKPAPGWLALLIVILLALALWAAISAAPQPQSLW
jgi:cytochrome b